jgi:hypothetical protein
LSKSLNIAVFLFDRFREVDKIIRKCSYYPARYTKKLIPFTESVLFLITQGFIAGDAAEMKPIVVMAA